MKGHELIIIFKTEKWMLNVQNRDIKKDACKGVYLIIY